MSVDLRCDGLETEDQIHRVLLGESVGRNDDDDTLLRIGVIEERCADGDPGHCQKDGQDDGLDPQIAHRRNCVCVLKNFTSNTSELM